MSDIFGEFVDQTNGAGNDAASKKWLLGEDLPGGALRNMKNPPATYQPDRMRSRYYWKDYRDEEGVHMNSGVGNKAAYLMTAGGTFNGQRISAIGLTKTARLFYTTNSTMLTSASNYADLARGLRQACTALVSGGVDGFVPANCTQVGKVIKATQMDLTPPAAAAPRTASVCPTGRPVVATAWSDDLETPSGQFVKQNLSGAGEWYYPQNTHSYAFDATWATSGSTNIWGYNRGASSDSAMRMSNPVTVPANGFLHFRHAFLFEYNPNNSGRFDGGVVEYSTNGSAGPWTDAKSRMAAPGGGGGYNGTVYTGYGNPLSGRSAFVGSSHGYGSTRIDLSGLAGQNVMFRWRIGTDATLDAFGWFIDDPKVVSCATAPNTKIVKKPAKTTRSSTAVFTYTSTKPGSTFQCNVDGKGWKACGPKTTLRRMKKGKHTFSVRAVHGGARDATPAKWTWRVK
jgi:hypothetical protein